MARHWNSQMSLASSQKVAQQNSFGHQTDLVFLHKILKLTFRSTQNITDKSLVRAL